MTSEGQIFSQQEMSVAIKKVTENKAADECGVFAKYLKALEVEEVDKLSGLMNGILIGADIPKEVEIEYSEITAQGWKNG